MTTPDRAEGGPDQPWDWSVDPPPPAGPTREPVPDPAAEGSVDEPPPEPPIWSTPQTPPPAWSTPQTPVTAPPLGGAAQAPPWPPFPPWLANQPPTGGPARPQPDEPRVGQPRNRLWLVLGIAAMLLSCCCVATAVAAVTWGDELYDEIRDRTDRTVALNQSARDGDLEFRVHQVECGYDSVGDPFVNQSAAGQYCVAELTVRNLGSRPAAFNDELQRAYGPSGEAFGADGTASMLANADRPESFDEIAPGDDRSGAVVYDIPRDSRIVRLRLHATAGSRGVLVRTA
nr:DUF4352 domain-containing protein [Micromonospora sp. DSM 115978]